MEFIRSGLVGCEVWDDLGDMVGNDRWESGNDYLFVGSYMY